MLFVVFVALVFIYLLQRIGKRSIIIFTVARYIYGCINSTAQLIFVGYAFAGDVELRCHVGISAYQRQTGNHTDAVVRLKNMERKKTLVVIH